MRFAVRLRALDNDIHELCMRRVAFHSISALISPQTTSQRQFSGHLAVNKLELIDFNSGQHPSATHSPGSKLNKLPTGGVLRSAFAVSLLTLGGTSEVKENMSKIGPARAVFTKRKKGAMYKTIREQKVSESENMHP